MACYRLRNSVQRYAWGSRTAIPELLDEPNPDGEPWAELWVGAHASAPSEVEVGGAWRSLRAWIEERPADVLGERVLARFGAQLPFLLKVVASERPLSLQVHPDAAQAAAGFAKEEAARVPPASRRFPDPNPKPELVCALAPFEALCGFRSQREIRARADALGATLLRAVLARLEADAPPGEILVHLLQLPAPEQRAIARELAVRAAASPDSDGSLRWLVQLAEAYPDDIASAAALLLHHVVLASGEALYLHPGDLHSYLRGTVLEVMASSDNVLRAGLTRKPVDLDGVLAALSREAAAPRRVAMREGARGERVYAAATEWFRLVVAQVDPRGALPCEVECGAEVLLCLAGRGEVAAADAFAPVPFAKGQALFVTGETLRYEVRGQATLARVSVAPS